MATHLRPKESERQRNKQKSPLDEGEEITMQTKL
jgi:hypothetical protein